MVEIGQVIKELRKSKKLTQEELAELLGVKKSSIQKYENGGVQNLKLETIQKLCYVFKVPSDVFVFPDMWNVTEPQKTLAKSYLKVSRMYLRLSDKGREKVYEYLKDIMEIPKYCSVIAFADPDDMHAMLHAIHYQIVKEQYDTND